MVRNLLSALWGVSALCLLLATGCGTPGPKEEPAVPVARLSGTVEGCTLSDDAARVRLRIAFDLSSSESLPFRPRDLGISEFLLDPSAQDLLVFARPLRARPAMDMTLRGGPNSLPEELTFVHMALAVPDEAALTATSLESLAGMQLVSDTGTLSVTRATSSSDSIVLNVKVSSAPLPTGLTLVGPQAIALRIGDKVENADQTLLEPTVGGASYHGSLSFPVEGAHDADQASIALHGWTVAVTNPITIRLDESVCQ